MKFDAKQPLYVDWGAVQREIVEQKTPCMMFDASTRLIAWSTTPDESEAVYLLEDDRGKRFAILSHPRTMAEMQWVSLPAGSRNVTMRGEKMVVEFEVPVSRFSETLKDARDRIGRGEPL